MVGSLGYVAAGDAKTADRDSTAALVVEQSFRLLSTDRRLPTGWADARQEE